MRTPTAAKHYMSRWLCLYPVAAALALANSCGMGASEERAPSESAGSQQGGILELAELHVVSLPDSFAVAGVSGGKGGLVLWASNQSFVLVKAGEQFRAVPVGVAPLHAAALSDTSIAVASSETIEHRTMDGRRLSMAKIGGVGGMRDAFASAEGWYVGRASSDGSYEIFKSGPFGETSLYVQMSAEEVFHRPSDTSFVAPVGMRSGRDGELIVTVVQPPHTATVFDREGRRAISLVPPVPRDDQRQGGRPARWASVPVLRLDCGFIQAIADVSSDRRRLVIYDVRGRVIRETEVDAPIGFVHADETKRHLYAVRSAGSTELVTYAWQWTLENNLQGGKQC